MIIFCFYFCLYLTYEELKPICKLWELKMILGLYLTYEELKLKGADGIPGEKGRLYLTYEELKLGIPTNNSPEWWVYILPMRN